MNPPEIVYAVMMKVFDSNEIYTCEVFASQERAHEYVSDRIEETENFDGEAEMWVEEVNNYPKKVRPQKNKNVVFVKMIFMVMEECK